MRPAASFRLVPPPLATRAACKSPDAASPGQIRLSSHLPVPPHSARTRYTPSASRGKFRSTELSSRAHIGSQSAFLRSRASQIPREPESRHIPRVAPHSSCRRSPILPPQSSSAAASNCAPARRGPVPLLATCTNLRTPHTCPRSRSSPCPWGCTRGGQYPPTSRDPVPSLPCADASAPVCPHSHSRTPAAPHTPTPHPWP